MAIALALVSALAYGVSDFLGGVFSRRLSGWQVAFVAQTSSTVCVLGLVLVVDGDPTPRDLWFGAAAGLATGFGAVFLYRGLSRGRMGIVAPVSAIGSALTPLLVGLAQGDRPSLLASIGVCLALPAIWLIAKDSSHSTGDRAGFTDGLLAGVGFGGLFALLGQVPSEAGLLPLAATQACSVAAVVGTAMIMRQPWRPPRGGPWRRAAAMGPLGALATATFLVASHQGMLSIVAVIASLYPASTVLLATLILKEKIQRLQAVGLALAAAAVALVALG